MNHGHWLHKHGYTVSTREAFNAQCYIVPGLCERAAQLKGTFVVWDKDDDKEGFLLVGDNLQELCREAWAFLAG